MSYASTTPKKADGYSAREIRALISIREETLEEIGLALQENSKRISETIDRKRTNIRIRTKLSVYWNIPYEKLWGTESEAAAA